MNNYIIAKNYRDTSGRVGGVVVIFNGQVSGWMNALRDPQHWAPGCIAVDHDGNQYEAIGGNDYNGAEHWKQI
jgi:hypothetical protein